MFSLGDVVMKIKPEGMCALLTSTGRSMLPTNKGNSDDDLDTNSSTPSWVFGRSTIAHAHVISLASRSLSAPFDEHTGTSDTVSHCITKKKKGQDFQETEPPYCFNDRGAWCPENFAYQQQTCSGHDFYIQNQFFWAAVLNQAATCPLIIDISHH